jgi:hypothetical protein
VQTYKWPGILLGFVILLIIFEWRIAKRKKGGINAVDRKMMRGMFGIGLALAAVVWLLQDSVE